MLKVERKLLACNQCDWKWFTRVKDRPATCPKCRSAKWDQPKKESFKEQLEKLELENV